MAYRFLDFELDESRRELRLHGREVAVQPRVFDLLAYLIGHRDRVVSKDELLEALWPDVVVVDGALQRVISLCRSVLRQGDGVALIRTYPRRGYRFCGDVSSGDGHSLESATPDEALGRGRAAFGACDWQEAIAAFETADRQLPLAGVDLERWAQAAHWSGQLLRALNPLERAVAAYAAGGDRPGAARAALLLSQVALERLEIDVASGWLRRADRFLQSLGDCREQGLRHALAARLAMFEGELETALEHGRRAHGIGLTLEDPDLEGLGLLYSGHALLGLGRVRDGVALQNEAAAAVLGGQVSPWAGALIYCGVVYACRNRADWGRAGQWTEQFGRWCANHGLTAFPGTCRLHRAEVLTARGQLEQAEREIAASTEQLADWAPWAVGDAYRVLGDLRLGLGRLDEAENAFERARSLGWDPQPGFAMLLMVRGYHDEAVRSLEASLGDGHWVNRERRGLLLAHLVLACARAGRLEEGRRVLETLDAEPELWATSALQAMVLRGRAELAWRSDARDRAVGCLREAASTWQRLASPLHEAHLRWCLGRWLLEMGEHREAAFELGLAAAAFDGHGAADLAGRCRQVMQAAG